MSGDGNTKHTEDYLTLHPWSGDNGSHEDWEKVLSLKALSLGGNIMYQSERSKGAGFQGNIHKVSIHVRTYSRTYATCVVVAAAVDPMLFGASR